MNLFLKGVICVKYIKITVKTKKRQMVQGGWNRPWLYQILSLHLILHILSNFKSNKKYTYIFYLDLVREMQFKAKNLCSVCREFWFLNANPLNTKSESDLFLYTRNLEYERSKLVEYKIPFWIWSLVFLNSQRIFSRKKLL